MERTDVVAEVTGNIWKIIKRVDERVEEGGEIMIVESMKMEIPVFAPRAGRVVEIKVAEGEPVEDGQVVAVLE